ncbi:hypothetical protein H5232_23220 [Pseudoalteromonas sp. SG41-5]|uniref:hypothetical protein n=1 Tax=Pseudoalteromonas sp. SG41-5 TaxID=2760975 RepID=UPI0015FF8027|nr:hypothetical protein [Pseudoalteromonas sp. SG41-5]MBB1471300.1 hypothetical protein [Pseudoalteromonas sp. SG41-5]
MHRKSYSKVNNASAQCERGNAAVPRIPELRRVVVITEHGNDVPTTHMLEVIQDQSY